ncbi:MAG TPA: hydroxymethylglutaryl-CoA lyase, partial [Candidatus Kapabacteria bacterium]|nr:hydroxymethylglutaryl-CoA lyase [Candidatus Kapabacteria bacterium]
MKNIFIHEVGMRDGLQMEKSVVPKEKKLEWIDQLVSANVDIIQIGSFVNPQRMPQMADTDELFQEINQK